MSLHCRAHSVPVCGARYTQWFVRMKPLAGPASARSKTTLCALSPSSGKHLLRLMRNIRDWCISRQLWWGHRIPAWYDANGNCFGDARSRGAKRTTSHDVEPRRTSMCSTRGSAGFVALLHARMARQDRWTSRYYPTPVLITGFDIIFFWVARMVYSAGCTMGEVPFRGRSPASMPRFATSPGRRCPRPRATSSIRSMGLPTTARMPSVYVGYCSRAVTSRARTC